MVFMLAVQTKHELLINAENSLIESSGYVKTIKYNARTFWGGGISSIQVHMSADKNNHSEERI